MNLLSCLIGDSLLVGIFGSLIAGFITLALVEWYKQYKISCENKNFKKVFGTYDNDQIHLIVPALSVRPDVTNLLQNSTLPGNQYPLIKFGGAFIKSSNLLGYADVLSLKYILNNTSKVYGTKSIIMTDQDLNNHLDISFVSFGGSSFYCTYVLSQNDNNFYKFVENRIEKVNDPNISFQIDNTYDYGLIIKYRHVNFPDKTWIIIAGLGESGTSGAGWFLSTHWEKISREMGDKTFGIVVRVNHRIDNSAVEVHRSV